MSEPTMELEVCTCCYYTETVPDGPHRVKPGLWVVVTDRGLYTLDAEKELCVRAKVLHRFTENYTG